MKTYQIMIANLKCQGCATTITKELHKIVGVKVVNVDLQNDTVTIESNDVSRKEIVEKLHSLGYPEATEENGLVLQLKSYGSCMIGRIDNLKTA